MPFGMHGAPVSIPRLLRAYLCVF